MNKERMLYTALVLNIKGLDGGKYRDDIYIKLKELGYCKITNVDTTWIIESKDLANVKSDLEEIIREIEKVIDDLHLFDLDPYISDLELEVFCCNGLKKDSYMLNV